MAIPDLLILPSEEDYKKHFVNKYCNPGQIPTWDGIPVVFYEDMFEHAFYKRRNKTWRSPKSEIDIERCKRMDWIKDVLEDPDIIPKQGYDKENNRNDNNSRVALLSEERYLVVIRKAGQKWRFVTAYLIDNDRTYNKILSSPNWIKTN